MRLYLPVLKLSLVIGLVLLGLQYLNKLGAYPGFAWLSFGFFTVLTMLILGISALSQTMSDPRKSVYVILGAMLMRFLFSGLFILVYIVFVRPSGVSFVTPFFVMYLLYTVVETRQLLSLSPQKGSTKPIG